MDFDRVLINIRNWAEEVGKIQLSRLSENLRYSTKSTGIDMVTEVDLLSEKILLERINEYYPDHSILSEERGLIDKHSEYTWVIDPLDGTTNYLHGYPIFSVSIALKKHDKSVLGVVYVPRLDEMFHAIEGRGAFVNDKRIHVSLNQNLESALLVTGFPYDKKISNENNIDLFCGIIKDIQGIRRSGSAAFDMCSVSMGRVDGYWELKLSPWDMAAGEIIVKEAGGMVITSETKKENGDLGINIIAGNEAIVNNIHERICSIGNYYK